MKKPIFALIAAFWTITACAQTQHFDLNTSDVNNRGAIPFAVNWPNDPVIDSTINVTNDSELQSAIEQNGARIEVAAGTYSGITIEGNDLHVLLDDNAVIQGGVMILGQRVILEGGSMDDPSSNFTVMNTSDVLIKNMDINARSVQNGVGGGFQWHTSRVAFVHNTIVSQRTGMYSPGTNEATGHKANDHIYAANYVSGGMTPGQSGLEAAFRIMGVERVILVDNRARCGFDGQGIKHTYRSHYGNKDFWFRRNLTEYGDGVYMKPRANQQPTVPANYLGAHWIYDFEHYTTNLSAHALRQEVTPVNWYEPTVFVGSRGYFGTDGGPYYLSPQAGDVINDNLSFAYQPPPAIDMWLAGDGLPPGINRGGVVEPPLDSDGDDIADGEDNCPFMPNADQADTDGDGTGDVCDLQDNRDVDGDGVQRYLDCNDDIGGELVYQNLSGYLDADLDGDGVEPLLTNICSGDTLLIGYSDNANDPCPDDASNLCDCPVCPVCPATPDVDAIMGTLQLQIDASKLNIDNALEAARQQLNIQ